MKKFFGFLFALIVVIAIAIPILLWPTNSIHLKEDVVDTQTDYLSMIDIRDASVEWKGNSVSVSVPIAVDDAFLNKLLLEKLSFPSMTIDGSSVTIKDQRVLMTVQVSKNGNFATQLNMSLVPVVQDGKLYLMVDKCHWGRLPVPKSVIEKYVPAQYYDKSMNAFVIEIPEDYHAVINSVSVNNGDLILTLSSVKLDISSPGALWSQLIGK